MLLTLDLLVLIRPPSRTYQGYDGQDGIYRPGSRFTPKSKSRSSKYRYSTSLLGFVFQASFNLDRGAGGISIAPLLHINPLLDQRTSVVYGILDMLHDNIRVTENLGDYEKSIDLTIRQLQEAFDRREASPLDIVWLWSECSVLDVSLFPYIHPCQSLSTG